LTSTRELLLDIARHLSGRRKRQLALLALVTLAAAVAELVSLGSVLPFLAVLTEPNRFWQHPVVESLAPLMGWASPADLLIPASVLFALAAVLAAGVRLLNLWLGGRLAAAIGSDLSCEAYRRTLFQPYAVHVQRNSSAVINSVTSQTVRTVAALNAVLLMATSALVASALFFGLLLIDWGVALSAAALLGGVYVVIGAFSSRELIRNSESRTSAGRESVRALQEGLGAIRDVLLDGTQEAYLTIYRRSDRPIRQLDARNVFISQFPRYVLESLGLLGIGFLAVLLVIQRGSGAIAVPLLGSFALGAQRLLPALQQAYGSWSTLKSYNADLAGVLGMLEQPVPSLLKASRPTAFAQGLQFYKVRFRYHPEAPDVLRGLSFSIPKGQRVGIIGSTGSGKSTTVDLLMGLLDPTDGQILVDGLPLHDPAHPERLPAWRAAIAHVPQSIYLADNSIAENIAFGVPPETIDHSRVRLAAEQAQIAAFIEASPAGYDSFVGERGIRLSGGQRQRLGIARALYKQASVLILDEATSALDTATELSVMEAINQLSRNLTVVMIAHRLSTVSQCDRVIRLEHGRVVADGPPSEVLAQA